MDLEIFRETLAKRGFNEAQTEQGMQTVFGFIEFAGLQNLEINDIETLTAYSQKLIDTANNTWYNIYSLALYGKLIGNETLAVNALELLDGVEALGNLKAKLGKVLGQIEADKLFEGVEIPQLGKPNTVRPKAMSTIISRMESVYGTGKTAEMIGNCLRDLDDSCYAADKKLFEDCGRDIPKFIQARGDRFLGELIAMKNEGRLYFTQPIIDEVIEFVKANPEIHYGVLDGNSYYETKIPHQTAKMLAETDPVKRRYHYCHCPWVKESLREGKSEVPSVFCNCSAGFHKRMWEVVLGYAVKCEVLESVLRGDDRCRFRVSLYF